MSNSRSKKWLEKLFRLVDKNTPIDRSAHRLQILLLEESPLVTGWEQWLKEVQQELAIIEKQHPHMIPEGLRCVTDIEGGLNGLPVPH